MDFHDLFYHYTFRLVVLIIVGRAAYLIFHRIKEGETRKVIPIVLRMCGYICIAFVVFLFLSTSLITYGEHFWVKGNMYESESREPVDGVRIEVSFYKYILASRESRDRVFALHEGYPRTVVKGDRITSQGITNEHGYFILYTGYMAGDVPFAYPLLGELEKKWAWVIYRKEGYQEHILKQNVRKWRRIAGTRSSLELKGTPNKIPDVYLQKLIAPDS